MKSSYIPNDKPVSSIETVQSQNDFMLIFLWCEKVS